MGLGHLMAMCLEQEHPLRSLLKLLSSSWAHLQFNSSEGILGPKEHISRLRILAKNGLIIGKKAPNNQALV